MSTTIAPRLAAITRTRTFALAHVLGGDALSHAFDFTWSPRWATDGTEVHLLGAQDDRAAIAVFDARNGQLVRQIEDIDATTRAFALAPDGLSALLLVGDGATMLSLADRRAQRLPAARDSIDASNVCAFAPSGEYALYSRHESTLYLARRSGAREWSAARIDGARGAFAITAEGARYAFATEDQRIVVRAADGATEREWTLGGEPIEVLRWGSAGTLLVAQRDGRLHRFTMEGDAPRWTRALRKRVRAIGVDEESGRGWISVESSRELVIDLNTGAEIENRRLKVEPDRRAPEVYSPDGRGAFSLWYNELALIDCRTGRAADLHDGHGGPITAIAVAPDGSQFATSSADGTVRTWRASDGSLLWVFGEPEARAPLGPARYRDDGTTLLTYGFYNDVRRWDPAAGVELDRPRRPYGEARNDPYDYPHTFSITWLSPIVDSEDYVLSGPASSSDYSSPDASWRIVRYDPIEGAVRWKHSDKTSRDSRFALSPDGRALVQLQKNGVLRVLSMSNGAIVEAPASESRRASAIAFAPSGALIVCDGDGLWWHEDAFAQPSRRALEPLSAPLAIDRSSTMIAGIAANGRVRIVSLTDGATLDEIDVTLAQDECTALAWVDERSLAIGTKRHLVLLYAPQR